MPRRATKQTRKRSARFSHTCRSRCPEGSATKMYDEMTSFLAGTRRDEHHRTRLCQMVKALPCREDDNKDNDKTKREKKRDEDGTFTSQHDDDEANGKHCVIVDADLVPGTLQCSPPPRRTQ